MSVSPVFYFQNTDISMTNCGIGLPLLADATGVSTGGPVQMSIPINYVLYNSTSQEITTGYNGSDMTDTQKFSFAAFSLIDNNNVLVQIWAPPEMADTIGTIAIYSNETLLFAYSYSTPIVKIMGESYYLPLLISYPNVAAALPVGPFPFPNGVPYNGLPWLPSYLDLPLKPDLRYAAFYVLKDISLEGIIHQYYPIAVVIDGSWAQFVLYSENISTDLFNNLIALTNGIIEIGTFTVTTPPPVPFSIGVFNSHTSQSLEVCLEYVFPISVTIPLNAPGSYAVANSASSTTVKYQINKNGNPVGYVQFNGGAPQGQYIWSASQVFNSGDILQIIAPSSPDNTLADIGWTIVGIRN